MKASLALLALVSAATAQTTASSDASNLDPETPAERFADYVQEICFPYNETNGQPLWDAPCNAAQNIIIECTYGPQYNFSDSGSSWNENTTMLSNRTQQACICESQFWDQQWGCNLCFEKHGDTDFGMDVSQNVYTSLSSSYCAASTTPTLAFGDWLEIAGESALRTISAPSTTATSYTDPIGNRTQVSLYFTPSVTGSPAYNAAVATGSISLHTVNGQIVATASVSGRTSVNDASNSSGASPSGSTTTSHAAAGTPQTFAAAAGVIGFAGLVALL